MTWMRNMIAPAIAAAMLVSFAMATPGLAGPRPATPIPAHSDAALALLLADPEQAAAFLADPALLQLLAVPASAPPADGVFDAALATLKELLALDEIRPRVQLALGLLHHRLGLEGAAQGYLLAALAHGTLPAEFRDRARAVLGPALPEQAPPALRAGGGSRLSGSLTTGLHYAAPGRTGALMRSPTELVGDAAVRDLFVQVNVAHRFDAGIGGIEWQTGLQAQTTRLFADVADGGYLALNAGPRLPLSNFGLKGGLRLLGGIEFGAVDDRLDSLSPGLSLMIDRPLAGGSVAAAFDWRERRYYDSAFNPYNSLRSGRQLAGRLGYDFRLSDWMGGAASARFASYEARQRSDSFSEWQVGLSLSSRALPALVEQTAVLISSQWQRGWLGDAWLGDAWPQPQPPQGWLQRLMPAGSGGVLALSQTMSFQIEGGLSRRNTPLVEPDGPHWYGRTGIAWQF